MPYAESTGPPTDEHLIPYDFQQDELRWSLASGAFTPHQLDLLRDPEGYEKAQLGAIDEALKHENPALSDELFSFIQKRVDAIDPENRSARSDMVLFGAQEYADRQAAIEAWFSDPGYINSISSHDLKLMTVATIEERQALTGVIAAEYTESKQTFATANRSEMDIHSKIDQTTLEEERAAANKLLSLLDDNNAFNDYLLGLKVPVDVKKLIEADVPTTEILSKLEELHIGFKNTPAESTEAATGNFALDLVPETDDSSVIPIKEQAKIVRQALVHRVQKLTSDIEQLPIRQKLAAAAITGVVAAVTLSGASKEAKSPFSSHNAKPAITMVDARKIDVDKPSEVAKRLKIKSERQIPSDKRNIVIATAGEKYAKAVVAEFNTQNGISDKNREKETQAMIRKIDAIANAGLNLASHRKVTTPEQADNLSLLASEVMLAARSDQIAKKLLPEPAPTNAFQKEIIRLLEVTFMNDPGMKHMSDEDKARIFGLQARLMDTLAPKAAQGDIIEAFIGHLAFVDGTITKDTSKSKNNARNQNHKMEELNPRFTLAQLVAATSIIESGPVADPDAENWAGCDGFMQWCYWEDRAGKYLGNRNAPKTTSNQVIMVMKEWNEVLNQLGSGDATAAAWLKGPGFGRAVASLDKNRYLGAIRQADGNGTTILKYMALQAKYVKTIDVDKQMPFLKEVMRLHPNAMDWSLLDKEWPLYSYHRLRAVKPHAAQVIKDRQQRIRQARQQAARRHNRKYKAPADRSERARAKHIEGAVNLGMHRVYIKGARTPTRLYAIENFPSSSEESGKGKYAIRGARGRVIVGARHAKKVVNMLKAAKEDDIILYANSSIRKHEHQGDLWIQFGKDRNRVAKPGYSGHEDAIHQSAIDINLGKGFSFNPSDYQPRDPSRPAGPDNPRVAPDSKVWRWLNDNIHKFGYKFYWNEPWHISVSGN